MAIVYLALSFFFHAIMMFSFHFHLIWQTFTITHGFVFNFLKIEHFSKTQFWNATNTQHVWMVRWSFALLSAGTVMIANARVFEQFINDLCVIKCVRTQTESCTQYAMKGVLWSNCMWYFSTDFWVAITYWTMQWRPFADIVGDWCVRVWFVSINAKYHANAFTSRAEEENETGHQSLSLSLGDCAFMKYGKLFKHLALHHRIIKINKVLSSLTSFLQRIYQTATVSCLTLWNCVVFSISFNLCLYLFIHFRCFESQFTLIAWCEEKKKIKRTKQF